MGQFDDLVPRARSNAFGDLIPDTNEPGKLETLARGAADAATFGFDDKLGLDKERREAAKKANPWTYFMGELAGGLLPMVATGGIGAAAKGAGTLAKVGRGVAGLMTPGEINTLGQAVGQGAKLGTVYGGLSGAGHADVKPEDSWGEAAKKRAVGAGIGAAEGAVVGPALGAVGHGVFRGGQYLGGLRALSEGETAGNGVGALKTATRKLEEDRITPQQLIDQIRGEFPDDSAAAGLSKRFWGGLQNKQPITADQVEETVRRAMQGESATDISAALKAANGGNGPGESAVQSLLDELAERHLGPLNLVDRASLARRGAGDSTQMTMRAAAATPGEHLGIARENLLERQVGAQGRLQQLFERMLGTSDFETAASRHDASLAAAGEKAYGAAMANEQPFDLLPIVRQYQAEFDNRRGPVPEGVIRALNSLTVKKPTTAGVTEFGTTQAAELPRLERESMMQMWRYANQPTSKPQTLSQFVVASGGIKDPRGDVASIVGGGGPKGLIRNKGHDLDEMARKAWDDGFFPYNPTNDINGKSARPSINDFLNELEKDLRGDHVVRGEHYDAMQAIADKQSMLRDLAEVGVTARTEAEALKQLGFGNGKPGFYEQPPTNLKDFINARQNVKQYLDEAAPNSPLHRELTRLYQDITRVVGDTNPQWKIANDLWREGKAGKEAMEAGARMSTRLSANARENLSAFSEAQTDAVRAVRALDKARKAGDKIGMDAAQANLDGATARMELFKVGLVRSLSDRLLNQGETHNVTRELLLPGAQKMLRQVLGDDAEQFFKVVRAEAAMHRTYSSQFGSQTTPLREAVDELNWAPKFEAHMMNPLTWGAPVLRLAQEYAARTINAKRNTDLMKLYTGTDPVKQLEALRAMQTLHTRRSNAGNLVGKPVVGTAGLIPEAMVGLQSEVAPPTGLKPYRQE